MNMDEVENMLCFFIRYENCETVIELYEYDTVEILKIEIHKHFDVPTHKQKITGWRNTPTDDNTILKMCVISNSNDDINCLQVTSHETDLEVAATLDFVKTISKKYDVDGIIEFHTCKLNDAISEACLAPLEKRKILLLYLHKTDDQFSTTFMGNLKNPEVVEQLRRNFFVVGWNIEEGKYRSALKSAFKQCSDLSIVGDEINYNVATALCIVPIKDSVTVLSCLKGNISSKDFLLSLENAEKFFIIEKQQEKDLEELEREAGTANDMNAGKYQQLMVDMLGDRDYDGFEFNQHEFLKKKIAYALMGPPKEVEGYDEKSMKQVERLFSTILENSNQIAQYKDKVEISFIYNCTVPLPAEKIKRAKQNENYNPNTDLMPVPIFVLRKCHESQNPCRVFVDHTGRTYNTWAEYKNRNKLHECEMVLPLNGRYDVDANGMVLLERHLSPACGIDTKLLQGADYVSMAGGLISGGVAIVATMTTVAVAPVALVGAGIAGVSVGIYSIARSAYALYDRNRHKETLSFADSEARGAYINILAGALGFVGAGANVAVTQLASRGVNIGVFVLVCEFMHRALNDINYTSKNLQICDMDLDEGARAVVDTLAFANIGASGAAVFNSGYEVYDKWINENQRPSLLTMVQLTSSVLFFGNAVYNFRTCSTIIEETQFRTLENYQDSLRSNRHRKVFNKLVKETVRQNNFNEVQGRAEVISAIRNIQNKDEVFAVLTRSNKEMNKKGIKFSAAGGDIVLNGVKVDFNKFASMNKKQATSFLSKLSKSKPTQVEVASTRVIAADILKGFPSIDIETVANITSMLLHYCSGDIKAKIISAVSSLLASLAEPIRKVLYELFPNHLIYVRLTKMVVDFFYNNVEELEEKYKKWIDTGDDAYYNPLFRYIDVDQTKRIAKFFKKTVDMCYNGIQLTPQALEELLTYFHGWLTKMIYDKQEDKEIASRRINHSAQSPSKKVRCAVCSGSYYNRKN